MAKIDSKSKKSGVKEPKTREKDPKTHAGDIMSQVRVIVRADQTIREAIELLAEQHLTVLPVVNKQGKLLGLLTEKDVLRSCHSFDSVTKDFLDETIHYKKKIVTVKTQTGIDKVGAIL